MIVLVFDELEDGTRYHVGTLEADLLQTHVPAIMLMMEGESIGPALQEWWQEWRESTEDAPTSDFTAWIAENKEGFTEADATYAVVKNI